jgi:hypothetical protein
MVLHGTSWPSRVLLRGLLLCLAGGCCAGSSSSESPPTSGGDTTTGEPAPPPDRSSGPVAGKTPKPGTTGKGPSGTGTTTATGTSTATAPPGTAATPPASVKCKTNAECGAGLRCCIPWLHDSYCAKDCTGDNRTCSSDAECPLHQGKPGYCRKHHINNRCMYDACSSDKECSVSGPLACVKKAHPWHCDGLAPLIP